MWTSSVATICSLLCYIIFGIVWYNPLRIPHLLSFQLLRANYECSYNRCECTVLVDYPNSFWFLASNWCCCVDLTAQRDGCNKLVAFMETLWIFRRDFCGELFTNVSKLPARSAKRAWASRARGHTHPTKGARCFSAIHDCNVSHQFLVPMMLAKNTHKRMPDTAFYRPMMSTWLKHKTCEDVKMSAGRSQIGRTFRRG